jgi:hypothetical protein
MCVYCMIGDWHFWRDPPWPLEPSYPVHPKIPQPLNPIPSPPWPIDKLIEFEDLLRRVKELEDKLGCPCEPDKPDYLALLRERIDAIEKQAKKRT